MESEEDIKQHLYRYARVYAFTQGYQFGAGATHDVEDMSGAAARNILAPPPQFANADRAQLVRIAEKQLGILVDHMIIARGEVYAGGEKMNVIGEETLAWARNILCPMWPIC
ncbi:hypothetical protein [Lewinella sp. JB7]|uniref:hypothetical protein n=1 Tax=Lewinella sp. JB7 TaxID=2962887 RepID=UPI0020CA0367|nr:hypothetical protein [Lewinella sp. JB7]MCP9234389.1 hypothetical protein [Lewinella sp. JB7]